MHKILLITRRELSRYFNSFIAYAVVVLFLVIAGAVFWTTYFDEISVLSLQGFFEQAPLYLAFFAPAITMASFAEERRAGTLELMRTLPVSNAQIVVGKFLATMVLLTVVFAMTLPYPYTLSLLGDLDWGAVAAGYVGLLLLGGAYNAIGLMASSFTRDQVVAILIGFTLCFFLYFLDQLVAPASGTVFQLAEYASTSFHFDSIARGVIEVRSVVYYLSVITVALVITTVVVDASQR